MKLTDLAHIFIILMTVSVLWLDAGIGITVKMQQDRIMLNNILDTAAQDSLSRSFVIDGNGFRIDHEKAFSYFLDEVKRCISVSTDDFPVMLVTDKSGFWTRDTDGTEWHAYTDMSDKAAKVRDIRTTVEEALNKYTDKITTISIPVNEAEEWYNTVSDCSMLIVYDKTVKGYKNFRPFGSDVPIYIVSGAAVRKR